MATHLVRNEALRAGFQEAQGAIPDKALRPWAGTRDGRVVWAAPKSAAPAGRTGLLPYTAALQRERRALAETVLGCRLMDERDLTRDVLHKVSRAMIKYWMSRRRQLGAAAATRGMTEQRKYVTGDTSFGRVMRSDQIPPELDVEMQYLLAALLAPWPERVMNVHDAFLRVFRCLGPSDLDGQPEGGKWCDPGMSQTDRDALVRAWKTRSTQWQTMEAVGARVRPADLFDPSKRGRVDVTPVHGGSTVPGLLPEAGLLDPEACLARLGLKQVREHRRRGVDLYRPDDAAKTPFLDTVAQKNLNFGAGPSGTTGTLFQSAILFANLSGEELKEYLLGIVAYLVGGGMHSCHEVFTTASFLGIPYEPGKYHATMPTGFRKSQVYDAWQTEFWDIAAPSVTFTPMF